MHHLFFRILKRGSLCFLAKRDMKRAIEAMKIGKYALSLLGKMQLGLLLQIIQNEHPSADKAMLPIGQISLHWLHFLHFSSSTLNAGLPSSLAHDTLLSTPIALVGQTWMHLKHSIILYYSPE